MDSTDVEVDVAAKTGRARNRRGEGNLLRGEILAAAVALLDETGDERSVTLRSVARRVGIAAPSIYPHFPDQPAIMFAIVQQEFVRLVDVLNAALATAGGDPATRLRVTCDTYLGFAAAHPQRYRTMFGGLWIPDIPNSSLTENDLGTLGDGAMQILADELGACVAAGQATSTNVAADTVALWVGLHGLAHQRVVSPSFPWPADIADRIITSLAHLNP